MKKIFVKCPMPKREKNQDKAAGHWSINVTGLTYASSIIDARLARITSPGGSGHNGGLIKGSP